MRLRVGIPSGVAELIEVGRSLGCGVAMGYGQVVSVRLSAAR